MDPTSLNLSQQNQLDDSSPRFWFIGEHVEWIRRTWSEGGVGTKVGLVCLIAGECLLGIATIFGLPILGLGFYELRRQSIVPLKDRNITPLEPGSNPQTTDINRVAEDRLNDPTKKPEPKNEQPELNQLSSIINPPLNKEEPSSGGAPPPNPVPEIPLPPANMSSFFSDVRAGNFDNVKKAFEEFTIDINKAEDLYGNAPLHIAAKEGHLNIVKLLLEKKAPLEAVDINGNTPLHLCAKWGKLNVLEFLLNETNASVKSTNRDGNTPLHCAVFGETNDLLLKVGCVKLLLEKKAPTDLQNKDKLTPFHFAIQSCDRKALRPIVQAFLETSPDVINSQDKTGNTALHLIASLPNIQDRELIIEDLLSKGASASIPNHKGEIPIHCAINARDDDKIPLLFLNKGANIEAKNKKGETPLHTTTIFNRAKVFNFLKTKGASSLCTDSLGNTLLSSAARHGHLNLAKIIFADNPDLIDKENTLGLTPLQIAAGAHTVYYDPRSHNVENRERDRSEMMLFLIQNKANVDQKILDYSNNDILLLHWAYQRYQCERVLDEILKRTEKINETDKNGYTLLGKAAQNGDLSNVEKLLQKNEIQVELGSSTPLQLAAEKHSEFKKNTKVILSLINLGKADVNKTVNNKPFFHWALENDLEIFKASLPLVSNINEISDGYTLLGKAAKEGNEEAVALLLQNKADPNVSCFQKKLMESKNKPPLQLVAEAPYMNKDKTRKIVTHLIQNGADVDNTVVECKAKDEPFVHWAFANLNNDTLKLIMQLAKNIDVPDTKGATVLNKAVQADKAELIALLIEKDADIKTVNCLAPNETLFQWASKTEARKPILEALIKKGINN